MYCTCNQIDTIDIGKLFKYIYNICNMYVRVCVVYIKFYRFVSTSCFYKQKGHTHTIRTLLLARLFYLSKNQRKTICNLLFKHSLIVNRLLALVCVYVCVCGTNFPIVQCARQNARSKNMLLF